MLDARQKAMLRLHQDYTTTLERVQTALYFDDFEEAYEQVSRFYRWTELMLNRLYSTDYWAEDHMANDIIGGMNYSLYRLLPEEAA